VKRPLEERLIFDVPSPQLGPAVSRHKEKANRYARRPDLAAGGERMAIAIAYRLLMCWGMRWQQWYRGWMGRPWSACFLGLRIASSATAR
jgi:hypothetical protein